MTEDREALVRNGSDKNQVKAAAGKEKRIREKELKDISSVLETKEGRRFVWRMLEHCKTFGSVMKGSAWTNYCSGQQDVGHYIMAEVVEADPEYLFLMMRENKEQN